MTEFQIEVRVVPRKGILDPQGKAVAGALGSLGFGGVSEARVGRLVTLHLSAASEEEARQQAEAMCRQLLANPVTEDYRVDVHAPAESGR